MGEGGRQWPASQDTDPSQNVGGKGAQIRGNQIEVLRRKREDHEGSASQLLDDERAKWCMVSRLAVDGLPPCVEAEHIRRQSALNAFVGSRGDSQVVTRHDITRLDEAKARGNDPKRTRECTSSCEGFCERPATVEIFGAHAPMTAQEALAPLRLKVRLRARLQRTGRQGGFRRAAFPVRATDHESR